MVDIFALGRPYIYVEREMNFHISLLDITISLEISNSGHIFSVKVTFRLAITTITRLKCLQCRKYFDIYV